MSASNWAICPRCKANRQRKADDARAQATDAYGKVGVDQFDALRREAAQLEGRVDLDSPETRTFREDYEFHGAEDGEVTAIYSGGCVVWFPQPVDVPQPNYTTEYQQQLRESERHQ